MRIVWLPWCGNAAKPTGLSKAMAQRACRPGYVRKTARF